MNGTRINDVIKHLSELAAKYGNIKVKAVTVTDPSENGWNIEVPPGGER